MDKEIFETIQDCEDSEVDYLESCIQDILEVAIKESFGEERIEPGHCLDIAKKAFILGQAVAAQRIQKKLNDNGIEFEISSFIEKIKEEL